MGRLPDVERRAALLDGVVAYLAKHGLADVSLRPMARELGVSVNAIVHHFGSKEELVVEALHRASAIQHAVGERWLARAGHLSQAEIMRKWWRWMNAKPENLALVRLGIEAAALDATTTGLPGAVRAEQISLWREDIAARLVVDGIPPRQAKLEASLTKALFTGLVLDLLATGERRRLTRSLDTAVTRLESLVATHRSKSSSLSAFGSTGEAER